METSPVLQVVTKDNLNKEKVVLPQGKEGGTSDKSGSHQFSPVRKKSNPFLLFIQIVLSISFGVILGETPGDLIWFMWGASLGGGITFMLFSILKGAYLTLKKTFTIRNVIVTCFEALFLIAFVLIIHFCGFHAVHAGALHVFYPNYPDLLNLLWLTPLGFVSNYRLDEQISKRSNYRLDERISKRSKGVETPSLYLPYINVVKLHLLIFILVAIHKTMNVDSVFVYIFVYIWFFVPIKVLKDCVLFMRQKA